jgi:predicted metal-dependent phosphoesterase TrpH
MNPFKKDGNWFKGNIHSHSTNSDGWFSPEILAKSYFANSYNFLVITDHWKLTEIKYDTSNEFILIPGIELNGGATEAGDFHFVGLGIKKKIKNKKNNLNLYSPQELVDLICEAEGIPI